MKPAAKPALNDSQTIHMLPRWVTSASSQDAETVAFTSGAALAMLDMVLRDPGGTLPGALLRDRMALNAAVACLKLENRRETAFDIRDAICLARAGEALGPAGEMFVAWRKLAQVNLAAGGWKAHVGKLLPTTMAEGVSNIDDLTGTPVAQASQVLTDVLRLFPREEAAALMLADVAMARAIGWDRALPLLADHIARKDVRAIADGQGDVQTRVHRAVLAGCDGAIRTAADLNRRVAKLRVVAPKLRARGSDEALALFMNHDALMAAALPLPDRAARRLCDRLVELGVVRELTGRATFRLYGV